MLGSTIVEVNNDLEANARYSGGQEIVTVLVRLEDYDLLKRDGGPRPDQITLALRHYLKLVKDDKWKPEMTVFCHPGGRVKTFRCAIPKLLGDEIRDLGGRFDAHTLQAVRLFLL
ncbi:MAG: hypothetical protein HY912_02030 [Desulfomonile tiedjei]|uniref:Uncharacterized protein n=1 Tax=Desulfomonile tiedjei TaxID=2358 RepID=A0A9D6Z1Z8_9BACT|nr:hypothetical protein [Desulfomonile tiedjei]